MSEKRALRSAVLARSVDLGILLITIAVILAVWEFVVRYHFRDITTTPDDRSYFTERWRQTKVRRNSLRFREREFDRQKPSGVYRIAMIGDSYTFGSGVDEDDRFSNRISQLLNDGDQPYEVLNFGRPGTETVDHLDILSNVVLPATPDFVLLQWYVNDVQGAADRRGRPRPWSLLPGQLQRTSALVHLLNSEWARLQVQLGWQRSWEAYMLERFGNPQSPSSIAAQNALTQFFATCRQQGVPVGMVLFSKSYAQQSALDFLVDRVLTLCQREGLTCVDTRRTFAPFKDVRQLWANRLDSHPGPLAHRLVADALMEVFGSKVWIPASDPGSRRAGASGPHL